MKKLIISIFIALFLLSVSAFAFDDMPNDWSTAALQSAVDNGLLSGSGNKLLPNNSLKRAEMATILVRALGGTEPRSISWFTDVPEDAWYYNNMAIAYNMKLFNGSGNKLNPENPITREEAFVVLSRAFSITSDNLEVLDAFSDGDSISDWAKSAIAGLVENGYVGGSNGKINPKSEIRRCEFAQVMYNLIKAYIDTDEDALNLSEIEGNVIVRGNAVKSLGNLKITGDLIIGEGVQSGFEIKNASIGNRVIVRPKADFVFDGSAREIMALTNKSNVTLSLNSKVEKLDLQGKLSTFKKVAIDGEKAPYKPLFLNYKSSIRFEDGQGGVEIYIPSEKGYILYNFIHSVSTSKNGDNWRLSYVYGCNDELVDKNQITTVAEWEMAVRLKGRPDFIGGFAHGDEKYTSLTFYIDGMECDPTKLSEVSQFTEIKVTETSEGFDPSDNVTHVLNHEKLYTFNKDGVRVDQKVEWLDDYDIERAYLAMMPPKKAYSHYYSTSADPTENTIPSGTNVYVYETNSATLTTNNKEYTFTMSVNDEYLGKKPTFSMGDNGGGDYNKMYFHYCVGITVKKGDIWESFTQYKIDRKEPIELD